MSELTNNILVVTPDGRYFVIKGRLWRMSNPDLDPVERQGLVTELMSARREIAAARRQEDTEREKKARARVHAVKVALGERGPVWWDPHDGDFNQKLAKNTP
ncbi:MAG: hypothetical protein EON93_00870 [Burkholderiales bacterium]|nr:MAG: hypothetical protein EON93_00870 [Burkholderiales bacterium]